MLSHNELNFFSSDYANNFILVLCNTFTGNDKNNNKERQQFNIFTASVIF